LPRASNIIALLFCIISYHNGLGQLVLESEAVLLKKLELAKEDSSKAVIYGKLAWELRFKKSNEALAYAAKEIDYGLAHNDFLKLADAYRAKATTLVSLKKITLALNNYDSCMYYARKANSKFYEAHCYSLMAGMYGDKGDYDKAIELYTLGLEVAKKANNNYILSVLSNNLADAYQYTNRNTLLVQQNFKLAINAAMADNEQYAASLSAGNLAREYALNKQEDSMQKYIAIAQKTFTLPDIKPYFRASVCNELATIYLILKQPQKAIPYALMSRKVLDSLNRVDNVLQPMGLLMNAHYSLSNYTEAEKIAKELLALATQQDAKLYIRDAYKTLSDLAKVKNDYKNAFIYYEQYKAWNDSIYSASKDQSIANVEFKSLLAQKEMETKFGTEQKIKINKELTAKNSALEMQKWIAIIASVLLLSLGALLYKANKKKQKINNQLLAEKQIVEQQANEKLVLINEIHHRVKNNLTMLKSLLYLQGKAATEAETKRILTEAQSRIQSMALVHQNLYDGKNAAQLNLPNFIEELFTELSLSYIDKSKTVAIDVQGSCKDVDIEMAIPLALIMNELATNSFKYAFANVPEGVIRTIIAQQEKTITITYSDNGPGLPNDFDLTSGGFGFKVLNILTQQLNATIQYQKTVSSSIFTMQLPV
jgi:two-component system, sensor histidine kinase PdtaS